MDLNAMRLFVAVVEAGSFVGASKLVDIPKSTIARRIDELEESLGVRLWERSTRGSEPTVAGREFYERCRRILEDIQEAQASVTDYQREPQGPLRITASTLMVEKLLKGWSIDYMVQHPKVELDLHATDRKVDIVSEGFDLVVRVGQLESSTLIVRQLAPAPHLLCASPNYLEKNKPPQSIEDLKNHECLLFAPERQAVPWLLRKGDEAVTHAPSGGRWKTNDFNLLVGACVAGVGIALLPALLCHTALRTARLVRVLPEWSDDSRTVHLLYPSKRYISATVRSFIAFAADNLSPPPWEGV